MTQTVDTFITRVRDNHPSNFDDILNMLIDLKSHSYETIRSSLLFQAMRSCEQNHGSDAAMQLYLTVRHMELGQHTLMLGPVAQHMLGTTNMELPVEELKMPYCSFYLALEGAEWPIWYHSMRPYGVLVSCDPSLKEAEQQSSFLNSIWATPEQAYSAGQNGASWGETILVHIFMEKIDDPNVSISIPLRFDLTNARKKEVTVNDLAESIDFNNEAVLFTDESSWTAQNLYAKMIAARGDEKGELQRLLRIVFNTALYMSSASPNMEHLRPKASLRKRLERRVRRTANDKESRREGAVRDLWRLPPKQITRILPKAESHYNSDGDGSYRRGHWVRGHWRMQPYGPRTENLTRKAWIMPHIRGDRDNFLKRDHYQVAIAPLA